MRTITFFVLIFTLLLLNACQLNSNRINADASYIISSDLETVVKNDEQLFFSTSADDYFFMNGEYASTDFSLSGKQSVKLDENQMYALNISLKDVKEGQFVRASVWQKEGGKDGTLIASVKGDDYSHSFRTYYDKKEQSDKGWVQHYLTFVVTKGAKEVSFYIFSGKELAYFDDIKIEVLAEAPTNKLPKKLIISFPNKSKQKIDQFVNDALKSEVIADKNKKYVKASLISNGDSSNIKIKLKGDWTDHLKSGKTSYRVKMRDNVSFDGLMSFSIQHPKTRNYVHEWVIHQLADGVDLLSTRYDFINVTIDEIDFGVYALEEHFDKQLIESRNRREGPILKFDESGAWAFHFAKGQYKNWRLLPYFDASNVDVFKKNRTAGDTRLYKNFLEGRSLLERFKKGEINIEKAFDIDLLAKFYVITELSSHDHSLAWHNRRFYFNPVTQKLEPILFDVIPHAKKDNFYINVEKRLLNTNSERENVFDNYILLNHSFKAAYLKYLKEMTALNYVDSLFVAIGEDLELYNNAISAEDESYYFDKQVYYDNAKFIRERLPALDSIWKIALKVPKEKQNWVLSKVYEPAIDSFFVKEISVNAFVSQIDSKNYEIELLNYHINNVSVIGYELDDEEGSVVYFSEHISLDAYSTIARSDKVTVNQRPKKILFKVANVPNKVFSKSVINWPRLCQKTTRELLDEGFSNRSPYYQLSGQKVIIRGKVNISQMLYIPKEYKVEIMPGTSIQFSNGGGLIINNDLTAVGSETSPINIFCNDGTSNGFTVLNAPNGVDMTYVNFKGLSNLNYGNWELTGAVNIYESNTILSHVTFSENTSEDALNIIRSTFKIDQVVIENTTSDGFDADFCDGVISNSTFKNTGNDCIDFSGSIVHIANINIFNSGDKGISGGERSTLTLESININGAITGVASKDQSTITGTHITVNDAEYGFASFQKKGEYAPAKIDLKESKWDKVETLKLIDKGSVIILNGSEEKGTEKIDVDKLYERFGEK